MGTSCPGEQFLHELSLKHQNNVFRAAAKTWTRKSQAQSNVGGLKHQEGAVSSSSSFQEELNRYRFRQGSASTG